MPQLKVCWQWNAKQDIAIADKASKDYVNAEIAKIYTSGLLPINGDIAMDGDLKMGGNKILNVRSLEDYKVDYPCEVRERDLYSVVNKQYLNTKFLKVDKDGNFFLSQAKISKKIANIIDLAFLEIMIW